MIVNSFIAQTINYLKAPGLKLGTIVNFGEKSPTITVRKLLYGSAVCPNGTSCYRMINIGTLAPPGASCNAQKAPIELLNFYKQVASNRVVRCDLKFH